MEFTQRWLLMFAIAAGLFAISFLLLRVNIRTLVILLGIGLPLVTLWLYMDAKYFSAQGRNVHQNRLVYAQSANTSMQDCVSRRNVHAV